MPRSDEFFRKSRKTTMKNKEAFTGYNSKMKETARSLRKNMTRQEKHLWYDFLRDYPVKWYRQRSVDRFIVDFFCFKARLVIELDGSQHYTEDGMEYDSIRTDILEKYNLEVLRFTNLEVDENFRGVCETIHGKVRERVQLPE
jgi:very-short-patch-repair endonuclease